MYLQIKLLVILGGMEVRRKLETLPLMHISTAAIVS
jgi:hypothetical protein